MDGPSAPPPRLGVPRARAWAWLRAGELAGRKVSGRWRVDPDSVAALLASGRMRGRSRRLDPRFTG